MLFSPKVGNCVHAWKALAPILASYFSTSVIDCLLKYCISSDRHAARVANLERDS